MTVATISEAVRQAAQLARQGRMAEALAIVAAAAPGSDDAALLALGGAIALQSDQFDRAADYLGRAHQLRPDDVTVRTNLAEALFRTGREDQVSALIDDTSVRADGTLRLARLGGHLAQQADDHERAVALYRLVVERQPDDWTIWNNLGNSLSALGEVEAAAEALERAARLVPDSPPIMMNWGRALLAAARWDEAERVLRQAAGDFPADANPSIALFGLYQEQGREDDAYEAIRDAALRDADNAGVQSDFGQISARRNLFAEAEAAFERALSLDSTLAPPLVGLATVYERTNREQQLDPLRERAVANGGDAQSLAFIDTLIHKRAGEVELAYAALENVGEAIVPGRRLHLQGTMLDRLGRHDEAFAAFEAMNRHWSEDPSRPLERARGYRDAAAHAFELLTPQWLDSWTPPVAPPRPAPIFLVGFPRSGTTLLDTMLLGHPQVQVLEEEPFIGEVESELGGVDALPGLDAAAIATGQQRYFELAAGVVDLAPDTILVDKHPMHLNKVAVIRRLFPDARFILALRHPCDVVLSCFLTNFRINNAMANFLDLGDAATLYDQTFTHWTRARDLFDLPVGTVVYERLVLDRQRELRPLFEWLGLGWDEAFGDHQSAARARGTVSTASYSQVTEPIYQRATGRWHHYVEHLRPILSTLAPWVDRLGYSLDDGRIPGWPK